MEKAYKHLRKVIVLIIGLPVLIIGVILIPLPGPGLLVCFLGLIILSMEFEAADKPLQKVKKEFKRITDQSKNRTKKR